MVRLDNWVNLDMNPEHAALIAALRPAIEDLVVHVAGRPDKLYNLEVGYLKV